MLHHNVTGVTGGDFLESVAMNLFIADDALCVALFFDVFGTNFDVDPGLICGGHALGYSQRLALRLCQIRGCGPRIAEHSNRSQSSCSSCSASGRTAKVLSDEPLMRSPHSKKMMRKSPSTRDSLEIYESENTRRHYANGPHGSRAALESRARRAYQAIVEAEAARKTIIELPLESPLSQLHDILEGCDEMIEEAIWHLTGNKKGEIRTQTHGARLAAKRLPRNSHKASYIRECAEHLHVVGINILAHISYARDCGDFPRGVNTYDALWQASVKLVGNAAAVLDAVSVGFVTHVGDYRHLKNET